jgi:hypothetical protein
MITTRSLLCDAMTAGWISLYLHFLKSVVLTRTSQAPRFLVSVRWSVGRMS